MLGLAQVETPDWSWFEESLAYDNARLPQALIATGLATRTPGYVQAGLRSLRWLMTLQTTSTGHFRPVGTAEFQRVGNSSPRVRPTAAGSHRGNCGLFGRVARE